MHLSLFAALSTVPALAAAYPAATVPYPAQPNQEQLAQISINAGGSLSDAPPPPASAASPDGITNFQLIAFNELFEVAFFTELIANVTNEVHGYRVEDCEWSKHSSMTKQALLNILKRVQSQEELHALNANGALKAFGQQPILPCQYKFPVADLESAITFAATFTDVVLGTLQDVQQVFAQDPKNSKFVRAVASVIGQEGEQTGFYNFIRGKFPSSSPFLTTANRDFAFTAIIGNTVPGSCPSQKDIKLTEFKPLSILTKDITEATRTIELSWPAVQVPKSIVYISGQNVPVVVPFQKEAAKSSKAVTVVTAAFPFDLNNGFADGLTIAAATKSSGPFASADDVAKDTIFGPAPILIERDF